MSQSRRLPFLSVLGGLSLVVSFGLASADMKVQLKDGSVVTVPVNKNDVVSITFEDGPQAAGGVNWDFETGDLRGWTVVGEAFAYQPTWGDNPTARHRGQPSNHEGEFWIGGYEKRRRQADPPGQVQGDGPQGTLTSAPFTITKPILSFLVGGGCDQATVHVDLIIEGEVMFRATGKCTETMERVRWDLSRYVGRTAQVQLVDASSGGWGHINFDALMFEGRP
jgi:hypothetical protein